MHVATLGSEILVNTATAAQQFLQQITGLTGGGFVVTWADFSQGVGGATGDSGGFAVKAQVFSAAGAPVGSEILVNATTDWDQTNPQITALADGGFVVTWQDDSELVGDTTGLAVRAQVFTAAGAPVGSEILVNTATEGDQSDPQITALADGGFVVTWQDASLGVGGTTGDSSGFAVKAQVFTAAGAPVGSEILVNTATDNDQSEVQITALPNGGFVMSWQDFSQGVGGATGDTSSYAVKAQTFDAAGAPVGSEILVNTATASTQFAAQITALSDGGFVVTWQDLSQGVGGTAGDSAAYAVKAQVFTAAGAPVGSEILVNTATANSQSTPQITALADGGFVVTWQDDSQGVGGATGDSSGSAVKAQVFTPDGDKVGAEILVNTATASNQSAAQITALPGGGFVITWEDFSLGVGGAIGDSSSLALKAQAFTATGARIGSEILVNTATDNLQFSAQVATLPDGFVVSWVDSSAGVGGATGDSSNFAIKAQVFSLLNDLPLLSGAGGTTAFEEGVNVASTPVALATGITVADTDDFALSSATVSITSGFQTAEDELAFANDGVTMGNIAASYDAATGVLTLTSANATATLAEWQAALRAVTYTNSSETPDTTDRTVSFVVSDGVDDSAAATQTVTVAAVNDPPLLGAAGGTTAFVEGANVSSTPVAVADGLTVADADHTALPSATVSITGGFQASEDVLAFANDGATMGDIAASYDSATGVLTLTSAGGATSAEWQAALRAVTYTNSSETPDTTDRTISFVVSDGVDASTAATQTVTVAAVNDPPVLDGAGGTTAFAEGVNVASTPVAVATGLTVADADHTALASATVSITGGFQTAEDALAFANDGSTMGDIAGSYDSATGVLTLTSAGGAATLAEWQAALRAVTYTNSSETPDTTDRIISFVANDGVDDSAVVTQTVTVAALNDAPAGTDATLTIAQDGSQLFVASDFGFSDTDGDSFSGVVITTLPLAGSLKLDSVAVTAGQLISAADIAAGKLTYVPATGASGAAYATIGFQVQDDGGTAGGGVDLDPSANTLTINVTPGSGGGGGGGGGGTGPFIITSGTEGTPRDDLVRLAGDSQHHFVGLAGDDDMAGGGNSDFLQGDAGNDTIAGRTGDDTILGSNGNDSLQGEDGDDLLSGEEGDDIVVGDLGADTITETTGANYLRGGDGADRITGGDGFDDANGNMGEDTIHGGLGDDWSVGGKDSDLVFGDEGDDIVYGNIGNDTCEGGVGNDIVRGGQNDDIVLGGDGNDWLAGDLGSDTITGGAGADIFHTHAAAGLDRIADFNASEGDRVYLLPGTVYSLSQAGADTVIDMGGGNQMVLVGVQLSSLPAGWIFGA